MSITIALDLTRKTGRAATFITALASESLTFSTIGGEAANLTEATPVAILSPDGTTLALGEVTTSGVANLNLVTAQAFAYCTDLAPRNALLAIGAADALIASVPIVLRRNPMYGTTPPTDEATTYPTTSELAETLAAIQTSETNAATSATNAATSESKASGYASQAASSASEAAKTLETATSTITTTKDNAITEINEAADTAESSIAEQVAAAEKAAQEAQEALALVPVIAEDVSEILAASDELANGSTASTLTQVSGSSEE